MRAIANADRLIEYAAGARRRAEKACRRGGLFQVRSERFLKLSRELLDRIAARRAPSETH